MNLTPEIASMEATIKILKEIDSAFADICVHYPELTNSIDALKHVLKRLKKKNEKIKRKF